MNAFHVCKGSSAKELNALIDKQVPKVRKRLIAAIEALRGNVPVDKIVEALAISPQKVLDLVDTKQFAATLAADEKLDTAITVTTTSAANAALSALPKHAKVGLRFDITNPRAVNALRTNKFNLIREITATTEKAIRDITLQAFQQGGSPFQQARSIHDSIGLTQRQSRAVTNFRRQLEERSNLANMQSVTRRRLNNTQRRRAARHLKVGHLSQKGVDELVGQYREKLVRLRAETIARTETARASAQGQTELWRQGVEQGTIDKDRARRHWLFTHDTRVRFSHTLITEMNRGGVGIEENFRTPFGPLYSTPAGPNCRCAVVMRFLPVAAVPAIDAPKKLKPLKKPKIIKSPKAKNKETERYRGRRLQ